MFPKLPTFEISIGGQKYPLEYQTELKCSEETINEDLKNQSSFFAHYAVLYELADAAFEEMKSSLDMLEAALDERYRKELVALGKTTEAMIRGKIILDADYINTIGEINRLRKERGLLKAIKEAFGHRKDCLISLASNMRIQADPELFVKRQELRDSKR